jgi:hypothetical protein
MEQTNDKTAHALREIISSYDMRYVMRKQVGQSAALWYTRYINRPSCADTARFYFHLKALREALTHYERLDNNPTQQQACADRIVELALPLYTPPVTTEATSAVPATTGHSDEELSLVEAARATTHDTRIQSKAEKRAYALARKNELDVNAPAAMRNAFNAAYGKSYKSRAEISEAEWEQFARDIEISTWVGDWQQVLFERKKVTR